MITVLFAAWLAPVLIGIAMGHWQGRRPAVTPGEFLKDLATTILFAGCIIFLLQMVLVGAIMTGAQGGMSGLGPEAWRATYYSGVLWLPSLVIAYVARALKEKRK